MQTLWQDLTLAARLLRKSPGFTIAAVLTLALGIGANATIFSFADAMLLRTLPVPDAERIVHVYQRRPGSTESFPMSYPDYVDYRAQTRSFDSLAAHYSSSPMHLMVDDTPQAVNGAVVTASYFDLLQLQPAYGRFFLPEEDRVPDRDAVAVVSHGLWERRLGGTPNAIGRTIRVNDQVFTIVGIAPKGFSGVHNGGVAIEVWIPTAMIRVGYRFCNGFERSCTIMDLLGKLQPDVKIEQAQEEMDLVARRLAGAYPSTNADLGVKIVAARGRGYEGGGDSTQVQQLQLFLAAVGLVLLIGCANIAGLLLARAIRRRKEIAVRLALGATRARLVRQLFTESVLLALIGGGTGLLLAFWGKDVVGGFNAADYAGRPRDFQTDLSGTVIAATTSLTVLASLLFGLVPALQASRPNVMPTLKDAGSSGGAYRTRLRQVLVVGQITLAVTLMVGAALLVRSMDRILAGPGFDPRPLITLRLRPGLVNYPAAKALAFQRAVIERLESLPGVVSASPGDGTLATALNATGGQTVTALGESGAPDLEVEARQTRIGPRYFSTLGIPVVEGRQFDDRDHATSLRVAVVNDVLARRIAPDGRVSGRTLLVGGARYEIVGVVKDAQYYATGQVPHGVAFRSYWQPDPSGGFNKDSRTFVRVTGDPAAMMATIRREIAAVDPAVPISEDYPVRSRLAYEFQSVGMARTMLAGFAVLALTLSAVGLYGVLAFTVAQRTREIGVRVALGAGRHDVAALVLRDGLSMTLTGAALGLIVAWMSARVVASLLYGVESRDALAFLVAPLLLIVVALAASYLPARRAARVSPMTALRYE